MPRRHDIELFLKQTTIFRNLNPRQRQKVASYCREHLFEKGETIFREGQPSESVWVVQEGRVHLLHYLTDGKVQATCVLTPGETFCCLPALDRGNYPATAVAATKTKVIRIPTRVFHEMMGESPALLQETLCFFGSRLRQVEARGCMVHDPVERRVAQVLVTLRNKFGDSIPLTRQEIADMVGTTVETVIRTVSRFQKEKWVRSARGTIQLTDLRALNRLIG
ncbi:MAG: Crp/Fnr family transcriptional regulator [Candidatus Omnitrophica bacterium]|nr:Crp/Fnr family transcriptional regulator [Candidatus Omnitrophota bacterium]